MYSKNGMVATTHPLAASAGTEMLKKGGNAMDAAVATAAMLTVVEPTSNGIGGDAFMIAWMNGELHGMNASGRSPESLNMEKVKAAGHETLPVYGWLPVTVPGVPKAWGTLINKFGNLSLKEVLEPAVMAARDGFVVTPTVAKFWQAAYKKFEVEVENFEEIKPWFDVFGNAQAGQLKTLPEHSETLMEIGETGGESVYNGALADKIIKYAEETGGLLTKEDLQSFEVDFVDTMHLNYKGYDIHEIPPNGDGISALMALGMLKNDDFKTLDADTYHYQIEAVKQAFSDMHQFVADEDYMNMPAEALIDADYLLKRRDEIGEYAVERTHGEPPKGGTIYLAAADKDGNMVSYIQSNYMGFGSGIVVPGTGLALQNRGHNFSMNPDNPNFIGGGKRPLHTIIPGFITKDGKPVGPFGVMGGFMQPQGHLQVVMNLIDFDMNPQSALDAPRWQFKEHLTVDVEDRFNMDTARNLAARGHNITVNVEPNRFGRGQIIIRQENGTYVGGTESRTDGSISAY